MTTVVMYDDHRPELGALADLRPVFDVRTGCLTTRERFQRSASIFIDAYFVPEALADVFRESTSEPVNTLPSNGDDVLIVNGRCVLPPDELATLQPGSALIDPSSNDPIAARLNASDAQAFLQTFELPIHIGSTIAPQRCLLTRPWDVIKFRDEAIRLDLVLLSASPTVAPPAGVLTLGAHSIHIHAGASIAPGVCLDADKGAIGIDAGAIIRPGAIIVGPAYVGEHSTVLEHALIKANTAIGPRCKVAGEVGGTIFQSHSNKGHDGHLGDSWVGQWVNLGAGTTNSNLLNTYGEVTAAASPQSSRAKTGLTFFGAILGDHVKTAICTRLMTGSVIGTGAMIASTAPAPTTLRRFAWLTDVGETRFRLDRFFETAQRMMSRRDVALSDAQRRRLSQLYEADFVK